MLVILTPRTIPRGCRWNDLLTKPVYEEMPHETVDFALEGSPCSPTEGAKVAVIIGAGPAGLTAARELLRRTDITPIVLEKSEAMGGISRTVRHNGNRIDIGGHRFFSKSDRVMNWWTDVLPVDQSEQSELRLTYRNNSRAFTPQPSGCDDSCDDQVMLVRPRKSRIFYLRRLFDYPLQLSLGTIRCLGIFRTARAGLSYLISAARPIKPESTLEDFLINRFGRSLYKTFFKSYTEKVWGVPCDQISAEWGAQRIKGLSLRKALMHYLHRMKPFSKSGISQKEVETSLIERFLYPKYGPGQLWEQVADSIRNENGHILTGWTVKAVHTIDSQVVGVTAEHSAGTLRFFPSQYVFSTMPVSELVVALDPPPPKDVQTVASGLVYRDFITVGLLLDRLKLRDPDGRNLKDNWIYIQEPDVLVGRMQIFNNWSPYMVSDPNKVWIGLEYFCQESDDLWRKTDSEMATFAIQEIEKLGIASTTDVLDSTVIRVEKAYPAYFGSYSRFHVIQRYMDSLSDLFLIGRNGMHKYNNQDHSMLTAMTAVDNIVAGRKDKTNIWSVNTEVEYHEAKQDDSDVKQSAAAHASGR